MAMSDTPEMGPLQTATLDELIAEIFNRNSAAVIVTDMEALGNPGGSTYLLRTKGTPFATLGLAVFATTAIQQQIFKAAQGIGQ